MLEADRYGLKIPTLRRLLREGAHATAVRGVLPTVTYPSHTTMLTGVWPVRHGIPTNVPFDPLNRNLGVWYWYAEDIKAPTLWDAARPPATSSAASAGRSASAAPGIDWNIPEYWRAMKSPEEIKLVRAISTPGLFRDLEPIAGRYTNDLDDVIPGDEARTRYAVAMIARKQVRFLTIHMAGFDHVEHDAGPYSAEAFRVLEAIDTMVAEMEPAMRAADPKAIVCVVSDHGFAATTKEMHVNAALADAGLIRLTPPRPAAPQTIADWDAAAWNSGGSAAIMLKNPADRAVATKVEQLLRRLAADPAERHRRHPRSRADCRDGRRAGPGLRRRPAPGLRGRRRARPARSCATARRRAARTDTRRRIRSCWRRSSSPARASRRGRTSATSTCAPSPRRWRALMGVPLPTADLKPLDVLQGNPPR